MDVQKILALIAAAQAAFSAAVEIASEIKNTLSTDDQAVLQTGLIDLAERNDAAHVALQAKLAS